MDTYNDVCTYYTLCELDDNYADRILEKILGELMRNCIKFIEEGKYFKPMLARWESVETIF